MPVTRAVEAVSVATLSSPSLIRKRNQTNQLETKLFTSGPGGLDLNFLSYDSFTGQGQLLRVGICVKGKFGWRFCLVSMVSIELRNLVLCG